MGMDTRGGAAERSFEKGDPEPLCIRHVSMLDFPFNLRSYVEYVFSSA